MNAVTMPTGSSIGASADRANQLATGMEADLDAIRRRVSGEPRFKTLLVFGRDPGSLRNVYASGGYGFLHDMLEAAGGDDVFADTKQQSVQASTEMILARRPEVIIELHYGDSVKSTELRREAAVWDALPSIPAVRNHRVYLLVGDEFVVPHLVRLMVGADHRLVLPASALFGGAFLIGCDLVARSALAPIELPVGIVTAFIGGPFFLWLLLRRLR